MNLSGIDHIELYVGDARQAAFYYCTAFGFRLQGQGGPETGLKGQRSLLLSQGDIRMVLTSPLSADHPAAEFLRRHGDGVAVIAVEVDDAEGAYEELVHRGATPVSAPVRYTEADASVTTAEVGGFADVAHRLVQRSGPRTEFLPGVFRMSDVDVPADGEALRIIDHFAVCVPAGTLDETVRHYEDVFGFAQIFEEYIEVGEQGMYSKVVQSPSKLVTLTLIEPDTKRQRGQIDDFLAWHGGAGVQHIAFSTEGITGTVAALTARGVRFANTPDSYYNALAERVTNLAVPAEELRAAGVLLDRDHWGQLLQIFTESMHVRRTLFLEIIERRGALTFGSGNIRALYEAKNRELTGV
ncbi:4-hydroxyphenylpyruvate dioxygenase [Actinophytocola sp.]|uniref:4-hydroxyphenylpyruvate dioxygenase n=1 Tax=Actinophytocola sp. TaxID=1872138 RepID=UPI002D6D48AC|nr:4-hydroxyphenylpyruvate dioxygenase [Actinophytocola sp.]HYQ66429.1 4-hydroxyphenylpyruvate dioxygenase [Actinophytocola sp.]